MSLLNLTLKNITGNLKTYMIYFISMLFAISIYFTFITLAYSNDISKSLETDEIRYAFIYASILLIIFIYIFIWYSNKHFTNLRKKEIGLYNLLGLPKYKIGIMLFIENLLLTLLVLIIGILLGSALAQFFKMILISLLEIDLQIDLSISFKAVINTLIVFLIITIVNCIQSYFIVYKYQLIELFNATKKQEKKPRTSIFLTILAIFLIGFAYYTAGQPFTDNKQIFINMGIIAFGITFGTILLFNFASVTILNILSKNKKIYYKKMNLITISSLIYQMKSYALTLSTVSILVAITLLAFTMGFGSYFTSEELSHQEKPWSYFYPSTSNSQNQEIANIIESDEKHEIEYQSELKFITTSATTSSETIISGREQQITPDFVKIISESNYNQVSTNIYGEQVPKIASSEMIAIQPLYTGNEKQDYLNKQITINTSDYSKEYTFSGFTTNRVINWTYPDIMFIVNDQDYQDLLAYKNEEIYYGYEVNNDKNAKETSKKLEQYQTPDFSVSTYYDAYRTNLNTGASNVFIFTFLGITFILATGSILYFKQLSSAHDEQKRYKILQNIGVSNKDIKRTIITQNIIIFLIPVLIGSLHYSVLAGYISNLVSNLMLISLQMIILTCIIIFLTIYLIYYFLSVSSYLKIILNKKVNRLYYLLITILVFIFITIIILIFN